MTSGRVFGFAYVVAPALLILISAGTESDAAFFAGLVVALPLSLVAHIAAFVVSALVLPSADSNGAPVAAVFVSGASLVQLIVLRSFLRGRRRLSVQEG